MIPINLPDYDINLGGTKENPTIQDILRHRFVALTPEEWVRQHFVHYLVDHLHYPAPLMANEVRLSVGNKKLRADTVLYDRNLQPRMIVEYKAPHIKITRKVFDQILAYNTLLHVEYLVVSNGLVTYCCKLKGEGQGAEFLDEIPEYEKL
ncbi:MAG: type I restriction enzyme HsdR N-terminal domain-containing protein [Prevotella sp.]